MICLESAIILNIDAPFVDEVYCPHPTCAHVLSPEDIERAISSGALEGCVYTDPYPNGKTDITPDSWIVQSGVKKGNAAYAKRLLPLSNFLMDALVHSVHISPMCAFPALRIASSKL